MPRPDGRTADQLRPLTIERNYLGAAPGRVLISFGDTTVLCTASVESRIPPWLEGKGKGWITAEYSMLPGSTSPRKRRERKKVDGSPLRDSVAAISVGVCDGEPVLDLPYVEDVSAAVDMNVVMTGQGNYVEVQGTGEEATFTDSELTQLLSLAKTGIAALTTAQKEALGSDWPF